GGDAAFGQAGDAQVAGRDAGGGLPGLKVERNACSLPDPTGNARRALATHVVTAPNSRHPRDKSIALPVPSTQGVQRFLDATMARTGTLLSAQIRQAGSLIPNSTSKSISAWHRPWFTVGSPASPPGARPLVPASARSARSRHLGRVLPNENPGNVVMGRGIP